MHRDLIYQGNVRVRMTELIFLHCPVVRHDRDCAGNQHIPLRNRCSLRNHRHSLPCQYGNHDAVLGSDEIASRPALLFLRRFFLYQIIFFYFNNKVGALYSGGGPCDNIKIFTQAGFQRLYVDFVFCHPVIHAFFRKEIHKDIVCNGHIPFKINSPYKLGHGDEKSQAAGKSQRKNLTPSHFPYEKGQTVSFQNGCPCSGFSHNRPQLVEIGQADIHGIAILLSGNIP